MEQAKDTLSFKLWASWQCLMNGCLRRYSVFLQGMPDLPQLRSNELLAGAGLCFTSLLSTSVHLSRKSKADVRPATFSEPSLSLSALCLTNLRLIEQFLLFASNNNSGTGSDTAAQQTPGLQHKQLPGTRGPAGLF